MSTNPPAPIVPPADDDDRPLIADPAEDDDQPLDPDLNDDNLSSADADRVAATEGELDGTVDEQH